MSRAAVVRRLRTILAGGARRLAGDEAAEVRALVGRDPDAAREAAAHGPVVAVYAARAPAAGQERFRFEVAFEDGYRWPRSYRKLAGYRPSAAAEALAAFRCEVRDDVADGRPEGADAHHEGEPFARLAAAFVAAEGRELAAVATRSVRDDGSRGLGGRYLVDRGLAGRWRAFHRERARLAYLLPEEHRARHAAGREEGA